MIIEHNKNEYATPSWRVFGAFRRGEGLIITEQYIFYLYAKTLRVKY